MSASGPYQDSIKQVISETGVRIKLEEAEKDMHLRTLVLTGDASSLLLAMPKVCFPISSSHASSFNSPVLQSLPLSIPPTTCPNLAKRCG